MAEYLKLELNTFVMSLSLDRTFSHNFVLYGSSGEYANLSGLYKDNSGIAADASLFLMDSICRLLKLLHMAIQLMVIIWVKKVKLLKTLING